MRIAVVFYSETGHTLSVAELIQAALKAGGHEAVLHRLVAVGTAHPGAKDVKFELLPDLTGYDRIIFGAPVQAFSLCPVMDAYLVSAPSMVGKRAVLFMTEGFPYPWMGGNRAIAKMEGLLRSKGAQTKKAGVVNWMRTDRPRLIEKVVASVAEAAVS